MDFTWIILDNIIFGYSNEFKTFFNNILVEKIILFDLDNTLIKTKSKKVFPTNKYDWEFLVPSVPEFINNDLKNNKTICGIISNQKGLKSKLMITDWVDKIKAIGQQLKFHFVFASIQDDRYRKPLPDSWEYIKTNLLNGINLDNIIRKKKIYYIGDAAGRQTDFSDTDFKYAINCGFKFKTPEIFFKFDLSKPNIKNCFITYPEIPSFTLNEHELFLTNIFNLIESNKNKKIFIMMIGFPASGKSFLRKEIVKKYTGFKYINNDDSNNKIIDSHLITKNNSCHYNYIIEDNTNLNLNTRTKLLTEFDSYYKIAIWFDYSMDVIKHLNLVRMYWFGSKLLSPIVYRTMNKSFIKPELTEGFDKLITINNVFFNFDDTIKYYF